MPRQGISLGPKQDLDWNEEIKRQIEEKKKLKAQEELRDRAETLQHYQNYGKALQLPEREDDEMSHLLVVKEEELKRDFKALGVRAQAVTLSTEGLKVDRPPSSSGSDVPVIGVRQQKPSYGGVASQVVNKYETERERRLRLREEERRRQRDAEKRMPEVSNAGNSGGSGEDNNREAAKRAAFKPVADPPSAVSKNDTMSKREEAFRRKQQQYAKKRQEPQGQEEVAVIAPLNMDAPIIMPAIAPSIEDMDANLAYHGEERGGHNAVGANEYIAHNAVLDEVPREMGGLHRSEADRHAAQQAAYREELDRQMHEKRQGNERSPPVATGLGAPGLGSHIEQRGHVDAQAAYREDLDRQMREKRQGNDRTPPFAGGLGAPGLGGQSEADRRAAQQAAYREDLDRQMREKRQGNDRTPPFAGGLGAPGLGGQSEADRRAAQQAAYREDLDRQRLLHDGPANEPFVAPSLPTFGAARVGQDAGLPIVQPLHAPPNGGNMFPPTHLPHEDGGRYGRVGEEGGAAKSILYDAGAGGVGGGQDETEKKRAMQKQELQEMLAQQVREKKMREQEEKDRIAREEALEEERYRREQEQLRMKEEREAEEKRRKQAEFEAQAAAAAEGDRERKRQARKAELFKPAEPASISMDGMDEQLSGPPAQGGVVLLQDAALGGRGRSVVDSNAGIPMVGAGLGAPPIGGPAVVGPPNDVPIIQPPVIGFGGGIVGLNEDAVRPPVVGPLNEVPASTMVPKFGLTQGPPHIDSPDGLEAIRDSRTYLEGLQQQQVGVFKAPESRVEPDRGSSGGTLEALKQEMDEKQRKMEEVLKHQQEMIERLQNSKRPPVSSVNTSFSKHEVARERVVEPTLNTARSAGDESVALDYRSIAGDVDDREDRGRGVRESSYSMGNTTWRRDDDLSIDQSLASDSHFIEISRSIWEKEEARKKAERASIERSLDSDSFLADAELRMSQAAALKQKQKRQQEERLRARPPVIEESVEYDDFDAYMNKRYSEDFEGDERSDHYGDDEVSRSRVDEPWNEYEGRERGGRQPDRKSGRGREKSESDYDEEGASEEEEDVHSRDGASRMDGEDDDRNTVRSRGASRQSEERREEVEGSTARSVDSARKTPASVGDLHMKIPLPRSRRSSAQSVGEGDDALSEFGDRNEQRLKLLDQIVPRDGGESDSDGDDVDLMVEKYLRDRKLLRDKRRQSESAESVVSSRPSSSRSLRTVGRRKPRAAESLDGDSRWLAKGKK